MSDGTFTSLGKVRWEVGRVGSLVALNNVPFSHTLLSLCVADSQSRITTTRGGAFGDHPSKTHPHNPTTDHRRRRNQREQSDKERENPLSYRNTLSFLHFIFVTLTIYCYFGYFFENYHARQFFFLHGLAGCGAVDAYEQQ